MKRIYSLLLTLVTLASSTLAWAEPYHPNNDERYQLIDSPRSWLLVPGFYHNFDDVIGMELAMIQGLYGLTFGLQNRSVYVEAELVIGPLTFGIGPRWQDRHITPQMTFALPLFYIFPYWRWFKSTDYDSHQHREFGIMLKIPIGIGNKTVPSRSAADEVI